MIMTLDHAVYRAKARCRSKGSLHLEQPGAGICRRQRRRHHHGNVCALDGSEQTYSETIHVMSWTITINGCPNHYSLAAYTLNPNVAEKGTYTLTVPAQPKLEPTATIDLSSKGGSVGVVFSGGQIYSPYTSRRHRHH